MQRLRMFCHVFNVFKRLYFYFSVFLHLRSSQLTVACVVAWRKRFINLFEVARLIILY